MRNNGSGSRNNQVYAQQCGLRAIKVARSPSLPALGLFAERREESRFDPVWFQISLSERSFTALAQGIRPAGARDQIEQDAPENADQLRDLMELEGKGARRCRLGIGHGFRQRRYAEGIPPRIGPFEPMLGFQKLSMILLVQRVVLVLLALGLDDEIEGYVGPPQHVGTNTVDLLRPLRLKSQEGPKVGKRFLVPARRSLRDQLGNCFVDVADYGPPPARR